MLGKEKQKGRLCCVDPFVPELMWFLLEGLDSVSAIMESVAVMHADELKDQGTFFPIISFSIPLPRCEPAMGISLDYCFPYPYSFLADRSFDFEGEPQQPCQRIQFVYLHSSLSFFVSSYPRSLSIAGLNTDGTLCSLDTSMGDGVTLADTSPTFFSTSQDESTSGAGAGVAQDITDAREISSALPPSNATAASITVTPPTHHQRPQRQRQRHRQ